MVERRTEKNNWALRPKVANSTKQTGRGSTMGYQTDGPTDRLMDCQTDHGLLDGRNDG